MEGRGAEVPDQLSQRVSAAIRDAVSMIAESPFVVIPFGSRSRGTHNPDSDVDIFIDFADGHPSNSDEVLGAAHEASCQMGLEVNLDIYVVGQWNTLTEFYGVALDGGMSIVYLDQERRECYDSCPPFCGDCHVCGDHKQLVGIRAKRYERFHLCRLCFGRWDSAEIPEGTLDAGEFIESLRAIEPVIEGMTAWPVQGRVQFPIEYTQPASSQE